MRGAARTWRPRRGRRDGDGERNARRAPHVLDAEEPDHGSHQHHPLDAEVEDAGALREQLAERGEEQRRPVRDSGRQHHDHDTVVHGTASAAGAAVADRPGLSSTMRYRTRSSPPSTAKRIIPCITPTRPDGKSTPWSV